MLSWQAMGGGWKAGRYRVQPVEPSGWELVAAGVSLGHYARASTAKAAAARLDRTRSRRAAIGLRVGALIAAAGLIAGVMSLRMEPNPARAAAANLADRIDAAHGEVAAGAAMTSIDDPVLAAAVVPLPTGGEMNIITGEAAGDCYAFYWSKTRGPVARLLVPDLPCMPSAAMVQSAHNVYHRQTPAVAGHLPTFGAVFDWEGVLPPVRRQRPWVIPALLGLGAATLLLLVDSSRVLLGVAD
jgi:hypothetical protein